MMVDAERLPYGKPERYAHFLGDAQWDYNDALAKEGKFEPLPKIYRRGYEIWNAYRTEKVLTYKKSDLKIHDDGSVEIVHPEGRDV